jgi:phage terminase large subunit-like protein
MFPADGQTILHRDRLLVELIQRGIQLEAQILRVQSQLSRWQLRAVVVETPRTANIAFTNKNWRTTPIDWFDAIVLTDNAAL